MKVHDNRQVPEGLGAGRFKGRNFMKSIRFRLLIAALAVTLGSALAQSQTPDAAPPPPHHGEPGFGMGHELGFYAKALNVTDEQKTQMKAVLQKEHATMKPLMQKELTTQIKFKRW